MSHSRSVDGCLEDACDTGVLQLSGKSLRNYPIASEEEAPFNHKDILELDISKNRFHELPTLAYSCEALVRLNCYHNTIRTIPEGIRRLQNLQHVNLNRNFLQQFPLELCQLQKLRSLSINNNRIERVPEEIGKLKELHSLDISNNCIDKLPATVGEMNNLRRLDFHSNRVELIPSEICKLPLTDLIMSENLIVKLPTAICRMKLLVELQVDGNPLTRPPPQICCRGKVHIFKYLSRIEQYSSDTLEKNTGMRRNRSKILPNTNPRRRPISNISTISDDPSNSGRSFYDEVANLVTNAFGPYEQPRTGDMSRYNGTVSSPEKQRKLLMAKQTSGSPASPGTSRRAAQYGVTLPRRPSKEATKVVTKPAELAPTTNAPVVNSHDDTKDSHMNDVKTSVSPPLTNITTSNRKLPADPNPRSGSWNSTHSAGGGATKTSTTATLANATHSHSQTDVSSYNSPKPRSRSKAMSKDDVVVSSQYAEDILAPMRKNMSTGVALESPKSPSPNSNKTVSTAIKVLPVKIKTEITPVKVASKETTPDLEIKTPTAKIQPDTVPLELDLVLSSFKSDLEKEEHALESDEEQTPKPKMQSFSKPSPKVHKRSVDSFDLTRHSLTTGNTSSSKSTPTESPRLSNRTEGSPANLRKKWATIASAKDVELRIHNSSPNLTHRQSFPPREAEWVDMLCSPKQRESTPVFQQLKSKKHTDYTIKRQKKNIQAELEMIEDVRDSIEMVLGIKLKDDPVDSFTDGVILCQLVNRLFPGTIPSIMDAEPMNTVKRTKNIDSFLRACSKLDIKTACKVNDIMDCKSPMKVCECIQALLNKGGHSTV